MQTKTITVAMNGVTGRMGYHQHLVGSILPIREAGGVILNDGTRLIPEPILVGRNAHRLREIAEEFNFTRWSTSLEEVLANPEVSIYFDAQATGARDDAVRAALAAGKNVYTEKPVATTWKSARALAALVREHGVRAGVVHDKLGLPGLAKLTRVLESGFFGQILTIDIEFGYWIFDGEWQRSQRPSWNYRLEDGGGMISDMFPHWRYIIEAFGGPIHSVLASTTTLISRRMDEAGNYYEVTADDNAAAILEMVGGAVTTVRSSWCTRPYRDDLIQIKIDGVLGSAVAGTRHCKVQPRAVTGMPVWNSPKRPPDALRSNWQEVPDNGDLGGAFRRQWEGFLSYVYAGTKFDATFDEGVRDIEFVELVRESASSGTRKYMSAQ